MDIDEDEQFYKNYMRLKDDIHILETQRFTEDISEDMKKHIQKIRNFFSNFEEVDTHITDTFYRKCASDCESLLTLLCYQIKEYKTFNPQCYLLLLKNIEAMVEFDNTMSDLSDLLLSSTVN